MQRVSHGHASPGIGVGIYQLIEDRGTRAPCTHHLARRLVEAEERYGDREIHAATQSEGER